MTTLCLADSDENLSKEETKVVVVDNAQDILDSNEDESMKNLQGGVKVITKLFYIDGILNVSHHLKIFLFSSVLNGKSIFGRKN